LNLKHYVSVVTHLAFKASAIVKECAENPNLKKYEKGINDPVTDVVITSSRLILRFKPCSVEESAIFSQTSQSLAKSQLNTKGRLNSIYQR